MLNHSTFWHEARPLRPETKRVTAEGDRERGSLSHEKSLVMCQGPGLARQVDVTFTSIWQDVVIPIIVTWTQSCRLL